MHTEQQVNVSDENSEQPTDPAHRKRRLVKLMFVYAAVFGIVIGFRPETDRGVDFLVGLPFLIMGISWCFADAQERDYRIGQLTRLLLIFLFIIGLPIYFLRSRGISGFKAIGLALCVILGLFATATLTLIVGELIGLWEPTI